jgi:frataxin-like iron-binding protein CyaY
MYIYESVDENVRGSGLYIYTLKDGPISDIRPKLVNITNVDTNYTPLFLNLPPDLPNERSEQLWMMSALHESVIKNQDVDEEHWTVQILNDNELKFDSSFISKPDYKNFPESGFTTTIVNNDNNPTLHVIGGLIYSKELKTELITNYHFKYEFKTDKWIDLSKSTKSILPPVTYHKVVQADDSLILVTGYSQDYAKNGNFTDILPSENSTQISISEMYKFDLSTEKWTTEKVKLNLDAGIYKQGLARGLSLDIYNGKPISYMSLYDFWNGEYKPMLAILDYKAKEWKWIDVKNEADTLNSLDLKYHSTIIINNQLLMFHGKY